MGPGPPSYSRKGKGTRLIFVHSKVPGAQADDIKQGWIDFYWEPLKAYLAKPHASERSGGSRDVLALCPPDRVPLRVPRHDENRAEDDNHEDGQEDQVQEFREVARAARED